MKKKIIKIVLQRSNLSIMYTLYIYTVSLEKGVYR